MALPNPKEIEAKLMDAVEQINQILAGFDARLTELEKKLEENSKPARAKANG